MRQQGRDGIFDFRGPAILLAAPGSKDIFTIALEQRVQIRISVRYRGIANIGCENNLILPRAEFDLAAKMCSEDRARASMRQLNLLRQEMPSGQLATQPQQDRHETFDLMTVIGP